jgi:hypothetical protein
MSTIDPPPLAIASAPDFAARFAERLNRHCFCVGTDIPGLHQRMQRDLAQRGVSLPLLESHPHLFSAAPVFVANAQLEQMRETVSAIESVVAMPQWHEAALASAPAIAQAPVAARGVFMGYDFHLGGDGVSLIEINTNAGGAFLNVAMLQAQQACCAGVGDFLRAAVDAEGIETRLAAMFRQEWRLARGDLPLTRIAVVDTAPATQYLYPEFLLFKNLMAAQGIEVVIADPGDLVLRDHALVHAEGLIDLVYNRLTDFYLADPGHAHLRAAYASDIAVFTPHPRAHALYADKRNLILLGDAGRLASWNVPSSVIDVLARHVPATVAVTADNAAMLWQERRHWFFKPAAGFGSRGAYRGDKVTHKVFAEIQQGGYVAQRLVPPSERTARLASGEVGLKLDVRAYVYAGEVQLFAARLYQGQTTNFRTPGGGFAPLYRAPDPLALREHGDRLLSGCATRRAGS